MGTLTMTFTDRRGHADVVTGEPGTNFGIRIDADEAERLLATHGYDLPFSIMAAGYGDDADWCGLDPMDLVDGVLVDRVGWGPYEVWDGETVGRLRAPTPDDVDAAAERGYAVPLDKLNPGDALDLIERWVDGASADIPWYVEGAIKRLGEVLENAAWGDCAECGEPLDAHLWHGESLDHTFTQGG